MQKVEKSKRRKGGNTPKKLFLHPRSTLRSKKKEKLIEIFSRQNGEREKERESKRERKRERVRERESKRERKSERE